MGKIKITMELIPNVTCLKEALFNVCGLSTEHELDLFIENVSIPAQKWTILLKAEDEILYDVMDHMYNLDCLDGGSGIVRVEHVSLNES